MVTDSRRPSYAERPPRLLVLTPAADLYGSDRALLAALDELVRHFEVVLVSAAEGPMLAEANARGATTMVVPGWALSRRGLRPAALPGTAWSVARASWVLRRLHRRDPFTLVYANTIANALLPVLPRVVPAPLVVHVREVPRDRNRLAAVLLAVVERSATRVLCNSRFTASLVTGLRPGLAERVHPVPDGIAEFDAVPDAGDGDGVLQVVCVARIHPKKGQHTLIEAARMAAAAGHRWHVHFWGDALAEHRPLAEALRAQVRDAGLEASVSWHGYRADTRSLYEGMHVAVVPSVLPEEFSLVTAEAQMAGLAVVATGPGGPSDIVEEGRTGTIVAPEDPASLFAAIAHLEDPARRRDWGAAGRRRTLQHFTIGRYAPAITAELLAVLPPSPRAGTVDRETHDARR